jgi:hypothetical protein
MIPKKIHYCWLSGDAYPPLVQKCMDSWRKHLPDYELVLWDKQKCGEIMDFPWVKEAFERRKYAFAADYIRLYAVYHNGGIYLDSDVEVLKNFDELLKEPSFIGFEFLQSLEAGIFGAHKYSTWIKPILDYYTDRHFINQNGEMDMKVLPAIMQESLIQQNLMPSRMPKTMPIRSAALTLCPYHYFVHTAADITKNTYALHNFAGSWTTYAQVGLSRRIMRLISKLMRKILGQYNWNMLKILQKRIQKDSLYVRKHSLIK